MFLGRSVGLQPHPLQPVRTRAEKLLYFGRQSERMSWSVCCRLYLHSRAGPQPPGAWVSWPVERGQQFDLISGMARDVLGTGPQ